MEEKIGIVNQVYELVINFAVTYSFQLFGAALVVIAGFVVGGWTAKVLLGLLEKRDVDITLRQFMAATARLLVVGLFLIIALSQMGVSITPLIAAIGGLAVGASFAIQGPVANYGAGLVIILTRMYKVGDTISVQGNAGLVKEISLAITTLEAEDGEQIIIPNKQIAGEIHRNSQSNRIIEGEIGIAYSSDPKLAIEVIRACLVNIDGVADSPPPQVGINSFTNKAIKLDYRIWAATDRYFTILHNCNLAIYEALTENAVKIATPQQDVRIIES